jgi:hypothetical protein
MVRLLLGKREVSDYHRPENPIKRQISKSFLAFTSLAAKFAKCKASTKVTRT